MKQKHSADKFAQCLKALGMKLEYDEFHRRSVIYGFKGPDPAPLDDEVVVQLRFKFEPFYGKPPRKETLIDLLKNAALQNPRHPVKEYLDQRQEDWDDVSRVGTWLIDYLGAEDSAYVRAVSRIFLVAAVRRVRQPGCKFDELLVLEGHTQGLGKSQILQRLAIQEDWFGDDLPLNAEGKKIIEQTAGLWIIECGELKGMRPAEVANLKSTLSRRVDRARMAYGRMVSEVPREWVACGTTNDGKYLKDQTGNRRFWPVLTGSIDLDGFTREVVDQLWAEAATLEAAGEPIRLDPSLYDAAAEVQRERTIDDPWREILQDMLGQFTDARVLTETVWAIVGASDRGRRTQHDNARVGEIMKGLGWTRTQRRHAGAKAYYYVVGNGATLLEPAHHDRRDAVSGVRPHRTPPGEEEVLS